MTGLVRTGKNRTERDLERQEMSGNDRKLQDITGNDRKKKKQQEITGQIETCQDRK